MSGHNEAPNDFESKNTTDGTIDDRYNLFNWKLVVLIVCALCLVFMKDLSKLKLKIQVMAEPLDGMYSTQVVQAGSFTMGCREVCTNDEEPLHSVNIKPSLLVMKTEVTQSLYEKVTGQNPSHVVGAKLPVDNVSWFQAVSFANALSKSEGIDVCYQIEGTDVQWFDASCTGWRLPTEAEWEYAARGGEEFKYAGSDEYNAVAWNHTNSNQHPHDVCTKLPNGYGLCDMNGNILEWVWDRYGEEYYSNSTANNPKGPSIGVNRVFRGGGWGEIEQAGRVWTRMNIDPKTTDCSLGFRLVRSYE